MSENSLNAELAKELFDRAREAGSPRVKRYFLEKAVEIMGNESAAIIDVRNAVVAAGLR